MFADLVLVKEAGSDNSGAMLDGIWKGMGTSSPGDRREDRTFYQTQNQVDIWELQFTFEL